MEFLDRKEELSRLKSILSPKTSARFVVIYGRRRLGKSTLIKHVLTSEDVYYMAGDFVDNVQMTMLKAQMAEKFPELAHADYNSWEDMLKMLNAVACDQFTLCLDEFPYMVKHSPELPSVLQRLIDSKSLKYNLIICGSSQRMMQNMVLSQTEPLYGRADAIINVRPIPINYLQEALHLDAVATIEEYSVWGGVPRYWELREEFSNLRDAVDTLLLSPTAPLYDEPKRVFLDDMSLTVQSESLLSVVAAGANRLSEIAARMGRNATSLSQPLDRLIQMNYLRREIPFGETPKKSKKGLYKINDPLMDFYYSFIIANLSSIGRGRRQFVLEMIDRKFNEYVAHHWEYLCREAVSGNDVFGYLWKDAARWWGSVKTSTGIRELEIDVVAESIDGEALLVGECKWTNPEMASVLAKQLVEKAYLLPFAQNRKVIPVLFLKNTPKDIADLPLTTIPNLHIIYPADLLTLN